jgi:hypothetical protein
VKYIPLNEPVLKWERPFGSFQFLIENHIARVAIYFQTLMQYDGFFRPKIKRAWLSLQPGKQIAIFVDPDAAEIIFTAKESVNLALRNRLNLQLEKLMAAVLSVADSRYQHSCPLVWTNHKPMYTFNGIRVDTFGMLHSLGNPKIQSPTDNQSRFYLQQINKALAIIADVSPAAFSLIENFTTTIHLRQNPHHPNYSSWSTHTGIGKITASNFHYVAEEICEVIDFLIHESIHNFLHLIEEQYGPFLEAHAYATTWIKEKIVTSPWSGKKVDLGSYTHAIAVWYGLAQFWIKAQSYNGRYADELIPSKVRNMIHQACKGFLQSDNVHLATGDLFSYLNKDFLSVSLNFQPEICELRRVHSLA